MLALTTMSDRRRATEDTDREFKKGGRGLKSGEGGGDGDVFASSSSGDGGGGGMTDNELAGAVYKETMTVEDFFLMPFGQVCGMIIIGSVLVNLGCIAWILAGGSADYDNTWAQAVGAVTAVELGVCKPFCV